MAPAELVIDAADVLVVGLRRWLHVIKQSAGLIGQRDGLQDFLRHRIQLRRRDEVARNRLLRDRVHELSGEKAGEVTLPLRLSGNDCR